MSTIVSCYRQKAFAEEENGAFFKEFLPTEEYFSQRKQHTANISYDEVWNTIHRGSMPELQDNLDFNWQMFYGAYVCTYIEVMCGNCRRS